ncbi:tyrosine protein phosphatase [soil metagenome]
MTSHSGASQLGGLTDLHSHLVPGVDDGAPTLHDAMEGLDRMVERGVTSVATTPHLDASLSRDPARLQSVLDRMDEAFDVLREAASARHPGIRLVRAHEVKLDVPDPDLSDPRLRFPGTDVVLVEWPGLQVPPGTVRVLEELRQAGIRPLIAHPERYRLLEAYPALPAAWREAGAWLQVNHGSVLGRYGKVAELNAARLLARGCVDVMATDFHGRPGLALYVERARGWFEARGAEDAWRLLAAENPARILAGDAPLPVPPVRRPETLMRRLRSAFGGPA